MAENNVSSESLMGLKKRVEGHKDQFNRAQGQKEEVEKSIDSYETQLKGMGVEPDKVDEYLDKANDKLTADYDKLKESIDQIDEALADN